MQNNLEKKYQIYVWVKDFVEIEIKLSYAQNSLVRVWSGFYFAFSVCVD